MHRILQLFATKPEAQLQLMTKSVLKYLSKKNIFRFIKQRNQYLSQDVAFSFSQVTISYQNIVKVTPR